MGVHSFDAALDRAARNYLDTLVEKFDASVVFLHGPLIPAIIPLFRDLLEAERHLDKRSRLLVVLHTLGGTAEAVERIVEMTRHHFTEVDFVVPRMAMSAGTILCMSGDKIYMDYAAALGPIDPQVPTPGGDELIPASGYLDKVQELIDKSAAGTISPAEMFLLQQQDLAKLRAYENAKSLTIELLKNWLVRYKFKNWTEHRTDPAKQGSPVTLEEKEARAVEIAALLGDNSHWKSHGRFIGIERLRGLRLEIEDFGDDLELANAIRGYHDILVEFAQTRLQSPVFLHGRSTGRPEVT